MQALKHKYAKFAGTSYERLTDSRIQKVNDPDWEYDSDISTKHQAVFVNRNTNEVVTSFRGTKELDDLPTDLAIAFGMEKMSLRFKKQAKEYQTVLDKYENHTHSLSSHSLGGTLNNYVANKFKDKVHGVYNFNPGASATHAHKNLRARVKGHFEPKIHNFLIQGDLLSFAETRNDSSNTLLEKPKDKSTNPHSLSQFLD